ncbi:hypothetical protein [Candidatus Vidania fulgoroideorum]
MKNSNLKKYLNKLETKIKKISLHLFKNPKDNSSKLGLMKAKIRLKKIRRYG